MVAASFPRKCDRLPSQQTPPNTLAMIFVKFSQYQFFLQPPLQPWLRRDQPGVKGGGDDVGNL